MSSRRTAFAALVLIGFAAPLILSAALLAGQKPAQNGGLDFGKWTFTGKDKAGRTWTGTLIVEKVDTGMFDAKKYAAQGRLDIQASDGSGNGVLTPITFDPATRAFQLGVDSEYGSMVFKAALSADGKSLTKGTWKETERDYKVIGEGEWSAMRIDK
jgi:hypothetical protein